MNFKTGENAGMHITIRTSKKHRDMLLKVTEREGRSQRSVFESALTYYVKYFDSIKNNSRIEYEYECHKGMSSVKDPSTGIEVKWRNGKFKETRIIHCNDEEMFIDMNVDEVASTMFDSIRCMLEYVIDQHPDAI